MRTRFFDRTFLGDMGKAFGFKKANGLREAESGIEVQQFKRLRFLKSMSWVTSGLAWSDENVYGM